MRPDFALRSEVSHDDPDAKQAQISELVRGLERAIDAHRAPPV